MRRSSVLMGEEDKATVAAVLLDKYVAANQRAVSDARPTEGVPAGMKVLRHGEFGTVVNIIKDKLGVSRGDAETYLRLAMSRKPMGLGPAPGMRRSSMRGRDIYEHPQGHFLSRHDLHLYDDSELKHLQSTTDDDLDGKDDADDDSVVDDDGYATMTPTFDEEETLEALEEPMPSEPQAELEPQEAYEAMQFMTPLSDEEVDVLDSTPFLQNDPRGRGHAIRWVDDADHFEWLLARTRDKHDAMDEVLEDEMYGDDLLGCGSLTEEELMDRAGTEVLGDIEIDGWNPFGAIARGARGLARGAAGIARGAAKGVARGVARGASGLAHGAKVSLRVAASLPRSAWSKVQSFIPGRDRQKAALVKQLNSKLMREHTNFLADKDRRRGVKRPLAAYTRASRSWARNQIVRGGLPTSYVKGCASSDVVGGQTAASILGSDDTMGAWWNPFTWFQEKTKFILVNTQGERLAEMSETEYEAFKGTRAAQAMAQPPEGAQPEPDGIPPGMPPEGVPPEEVAPDYGPPPEEVAPPTEYEPGSEGVEGEGLFVDGEGNIVRGNELSGSDLW